MTDPLSLDGVAWVARMALPELPDPAGGKPWKPVEFFTDVGGHLWRGSRGPYSLCARPTCRLPYSRWSGDDCPGVEVRTTDERVAVWMDHWHSPHVQVCDSEEKAADFAALVDDNGESTVVGVQFADGRTVPVEQWTAFREAQERRRAAWKARVEAEATNPPPVRVVVAPFGLGSVELDPDEPDWLGEQ